MIKMYSCYWCYGKNKITCRRHHQNQQQANKQNSGHGVGNLKSTGWWTSGASSSAWAAKISLTGRVGRSVSRMKQGILYHALLWLGPTGRSDSSGDLGSKSSPRVPQISQRLVPYRSNPSVEEAAVHFFMKDLRETPHRPVIPTKYKALPRGHQGTFRSYWSFQYPVGSQITRCDSSVWSFRTDVLSTHLEKVRETFSEWQ